MRGPLRGGSTVPPPSFIFSTLDLFSSSSFFPPATAVFIDAKLGPLNRQPRIGRLCGSWIDDSSMQTRCSRKERFCVTTLRESRPTRAPIPAALPRTSRANWPCILAFSLSTAARSCANVFYNCVSQNSFRGRGRDARNNLWGFFSILSFRIVFRSIVYEPLPYVSHRAPCRLDEYFVKNQYESGYH